MGDKETTHRVNPRSCIVTCTSKFTKYPEVKNVDEAHEVTKVTVREDPPDKDKSPVADVAAPLNEPCYLKPAVHKAKDVTADHPCEKIGECFLACTNYFDAVSNTYTVENKRISLSDSLGELSYCWGHC